MAKSEKTGREVVLDDFRSRIIRTEWVEEILVRVERGLALIPMSRPQIARGEVREVLNATLQAFFGSEEGRPEVLAFKKMRRPGAMETRNWRTSYDVRDPDSKRGKRRKTIDQPLTRRNIQLVAMRYKNVEGDTQNWDTGLPVRPMVVIAAGDGSAAYVVPVVPEGIDIMDMSPEETVLETVKPTKSKKKLKRAVRKDDEG